MALMRPIGLAVALLASPACAAQGSDQDWPCVQRKIEHLSLAVMWPDPIPESTEPLPEEFAKIMIGSANRAIIDPDADDAADDDGSISEAAQ